jgi:hypothetical protein
MKPGTMIRLKIPATLIKAKSRRDSDSSSSLDLSDESGYSGVEDITDSDEDEEDVEAAEEEHIVSYELQHVARSSPRPNEDEEGAAEEEDDEDDDGDDEAQEDDEGEEYEGDDDEDAEDHASWDGLPSEPEQDDIDDGVDIQIPTVQRRVRFDVPESEDEDDTETDEETAYSFFPDLFVDKSKLDPSFRREVDQNSDDDSDAYWDHYGVSTLGPPIEDGSSDFESLMHVVTEDDSTPVATPMTQNDMSTALSTPFASPEKDEVSLDGYQCELM